LIQALNVVREWMSHGLYNPSFSITLRETTFAKLPPSIINEHTFP